MITVPIKKSLQQRLKEVSASNLVSIIPDDEDKKQREKEIVPDIREVIPVLTKRLKAFKLAGHIHTISMQERELRDSKKVLVDQLKEILESENLTKTTFMAGEYRVSQYETVRSSLSVPKLLAHNVSPKTLAECTEIKKSISLRVSEKEEEIEDES